MFQVLSIGNLWGMVVVGEVAGEEEVGRALEREAGAEVAEGEAGTVEGVGFWARVKVREREAGEVVGRGSGMVGVVGFLVGVTTGGEVKTGRLAAAVLVEREVRGGVWAGDKVVGWLGGLGVRGWVEGAEEVRVIGGSGGRLRKGKQLLEPEKSERKKRAKEKGRERCLQMRSEK
jgi:hypothetical protein